MPTTHRERQSRLRHPAAAYAFLFEALDFTQQQLGRTRAHGPDDVSAHVSGRELLDGLRQFALDQFGLMTRAVLHAWNIRTTGDIGQMVYELIEQGHMHRTDRDRLSDFHDVYDFEDVFDREYAIDVRRAFAR
jgi:uncharacterized repeat protein (TIGR04138 family)